MEKTITIPVKDLVELLKKEMKLDLLECSGVDSWEGYSYSLYPEGDSGLDDFIKEIELKYL